jgi:hypothetical protein
MALDAGCPAFMGSRNNSMLGDVHEKASSQQSGVAPGARSTFGGTSSKHGGQDTGAIIASLIALGYSVDEIHDL